MRARPYDPTPREGLAKGKPIPMRRLGEVLLALEELLVNPLACCFSSIALRRLPVGATVRMSITGQVLDVQLEKLRQSFKEKRSGVDAGRAPSVLGTGPLFRRPSGSTWEMAGPQFADQRELDSPARTARPTLR